MVANDLAGAMAFVNGRPDDPYCWFRLWPKPGYQFIEFGSVESIRVRDRLLESGILVGTQPLLPVPANPEQANLLIGHPDPAKG